MTTSKALFFKILLAACVFLLRTDCSYHKKYYDDRKNQQYSNRPWQGQYSGGYNKYRNKYHKPRNNEENSDDYVYKYNYKYKYNKYNRNLMQKKPIVEQQKPLKIKKPTQETKKINNKPDKPAAIKRPQKITNPKKQQKQQKPQPIPKVQAKEQIIKQAEQAEQVEPAQQPTLMQTIQIQETKQIVRKEVQKIVQQIQQSKEFEKNTDLQCSQKPVYDYNLLVLTWVPAQCYADKECEKDWLTYEDLRAPTIHGFRPFSSSSYYQNCFGYRGDENCQTNAYMMDFDLDEALWNVSGLLYDISQYWPAHKFTHDDEDFYKKQWIIHGSCYLMNMIQDNQNVFKSDKMGFNRTVMIEYFKTAINKFKSLKIDVQPGKQFHSKQQFAEDIGFKNKQTHFVMNCDSKDEIMEIIFCFNRSKLPGKQVTIPCTLGQTCDQSRPFRLKRPI